MHLTKYYIRNLRQIVFTGRIAVLIARLLLLAVFGPQEVWAGDATSTSIMLSWTAPGDDGSNGTAAQYDIRYSTSPISVDNWGDAMPVSNLPSPKAAGNPETIMVTGLEPATDYYFAICSADEVPNWSGLSNVTIQRTEDENLPPPVCVTPPDAGSVASDRPYLIINNVIDPNGGSVSYFLEVSIYSDFSTLAASSEAVVEGAEYTSWQVNTSLSDGGSYYWRARGYNGSVYGEWSIVRSFTVEISTTNSPPSRPVASSPTGYETVRTDSVELVWSNSTDIDGDQIFYEIEVFDSAASVLLESVSGISENIGPSSSFTSRYQFSEENWYRWRIRAFDGTDNSSWSSFAFFYYTEGNPPAAIATLVAGNSTLTTIGLGWIATGDDSLLGTAEMYDIRYASAPITEVNWGTAIQVANEPLPQLSGSVEILIVTGLAPYTTYYFAIKAVDDAQNWSALSNIAVATTGDDVPPEPVSNLLAETGDGLGELILSWTVPVDAASYQFAYSRDTLTESNYQQAIFWDNPPEPLAAGELQTVILGGLVPGGEYWAAMLVLDSVGNVSDVSNIVHQVSGYDFGAGTGDGEGALPDQFYLGQNFPNPFNPTTQLEFSVTSQSQVSIQIFNVLGQLTKTLVNEIKPAGTYTIVWNGTDDYGRFAASGVYTYRIIAGDEIASKQMVLLK